MNVLLNSGKIGGRRGMFKASEACTYLLGFLFQTLFCQGRGRLPCFPPQSLNCPSIDAFVCFCDLNGPVFSDQSSSRLHSDILSFFLHHVLQAVRPNLHQPLSSPSQVWMSMVFSGRRPLVEAQPQCDVAYSLVKMAFAGMQQNCGCESELPLSK